MSVNQKHIEEFRRRFSTKEGKRKYILLMGIRTYKRLYKNYPWLFDKPTQ